MVFGNVYRNAGDGAIQKSAAVGEACDVLEHIGVFNGLGGGFAPDKGGMAGYENSRNGERVQVVPLESAEDDGAGVADVGLGDFIGG
jgi:hypothetical protein